MLSVHEFFTVFHCVSLFLSCCKVDMLRERNKQYGTIKFVDISSDDYSPEENRGLDYKTVCSMMY